MHNTIQRERIHCWRWRSPATAFAPMHKAPHIMENNNNNNLFYHRKDQKHLKITKTNFVRGFRFFCLLFTIRQTCNKNAIKFIVRLRVLWIIFVGAVIVTVAWLCVCASVEGASRVSLIQLRSVHTLCFYILVTTKVYHFGGVVLSSALQIHKTMEKVPRSRSPLIL